MAPHSKLVQKTIQTNSLPPLTFFSLGTCLHFFSFWTDGDGILDVFFSAWEQIFAGISGS